MRNRSGEKGIRHPHRRFHELCRHFDSQYPLTHGSLCSDIYKFFGLVLLGAAGGKHELILSIKVMFNVKVGRPIIYRIIGCIS